MAEVVHQPSEAGSVRFGWCEEERERTTTGLIAVKLSLAWLNNVSGLVGMGSNTNRLRSKRLCIVICPFLEDVVNEKRVQNE